jgi:photoactive yellow protein
MKIAEMGKIVFDQQDIENVLAKLEPAELDRLTFGAIQVDSDGKVLFYNATEGDLSKRDPMKIVGKNFFGDVAPCCRRPEFHGRFLEGVESGSLDITFEYLFDYKMNPTRVRIRMTNGSRAGEYWILVRRLND